MGSGDRPDKENRRLTFQASIGQTKRHERRPALIIIAKELYEMTTENSTSSLSFDYPHANGRLYSIAPGVTTLDIRDALDCGFNRLNAMLSMTIGEGGESFRIYNDEIQETYLSGCALLAKEVHQLYKQLESRTTFAD